MLSAIRRPAATARAGVDLPTKVTMVLTNISRRKDISVKAMS